MARLMEQVMESRLKELSTKGDIQEVKAELEVKIAEAKASTIQWMFGVAAGQAMFIIAILKLFPTH